MPPPPTIVRLLLISMSLVIFCLLFSFFDYVPVKGEIIWYLSLTAWLISLSIMLSSSIHAVAKGKIAFFFLQLSRIPLCKMYHSFLIYSSTDGHLDCSQVFTIVNKAAMNLGVHIFFQIHVWISLDIFLEVELLGHKEVPFLIF